MQVTVVTQNGILFPREVPPYRGEQVTRSAMLAGAKLLVASPMPDRSKDRDQVEGGDNTTTKKKKYILF